MKKYTTHISASALAIALVALGCALFQNWDKDWNSVMFAVAMLSALVMVLVGWNILTAINLKNIINKEVEKRLSSQKASIDDAKNEVLSLMFCTIGNDMFKQGRKLESIDYLTRSLIALFDIKEPDRFDVDRVFDSISIVLPTLQEVKINAENTRWSSNTLDLITAKLINIEDDRVTPLLDYIRAVRIILYYR